MRVINRGAGPPLKWPQQWSCSGCLSDLAVDLTDIKFPMVQDPAAAVEGWFVCAVCGGKNYLTVPDSIDARNQQIAVPGPPVVKPSSTP